MVERSNYSDDFLNELTGYSKELYVEEITRIYKDDYETTKLTFKVYVQKIPQYSHNSITMKVVDDALNSWKELNPSLRFEYVDKRQDSDITIKWVTHITFQHDIMGITDSEILEYSDGSQEENHEILVDLVDVDCNGIPVYWSKDTVTFIIKHEIGHTLWIEHSSDENHLMYDSFDGMDNLQTHGLIIPEQNTFPSYVAQKGLDKTIETKFKHFEKTLAKGGFTVDEWDRFVNNELSPDGMLKGTFNETFINKINMVIDDMNPYIDKQNCFVDSTSMYDPYG